MFATAVIIVAIGWPPGVLRGVLLADFWGLTHFPPVPTLVGDRFFEVPPRWAVAYWLLHLEAPILIFSLSVVLIALWRGHRGGQLSSRHKYLAVFVAFFSATMLAAHIAGARNTLLLIGILCLATGALFDEAFAHNRRLVAVASTAIIILAALNLIRLSRSPAHTSEVAIDGYQAFLKQNETRLAEECKAVVLGVPILKFYAYHRGIPLGWQLTEMPWTTRADAPLAADIKYVLASSLFWSHMPRTQPIRRVVADHWRVVWSYNAPRMWELRLYENPQVTAR